MSTATGMTPANSARIDLALLIIRIAVSLPFLYHGSAILFGSFGGPGPQGFASFMHSQVAVAYLVGLAQFAGGIAILTGALLRVGAVSVIIVMLGAILMVHLPHGYDLSKGGMEFALTQLLASLGLLLSGAGSFSLTKVLPASLQKL